MCNNLCKLYSELVADLGFESRHLALEHMSSHYNALRICWGRDSSGGDNIRNLWFLPVIYKDNRGKVDNIWG